MFIKPDIINFAPYEINISLNLLRQFSSATIMIQALQPVWKWTSFNIPFTVRELAIAAQGLW